MSIGAITATINALKMIQNGRAILFKMVTSTILTHVHKITNHKMPLVSLFSVIFAS